MCVCSMISKGLTVEIWYATKEHEGKHNSPLEWQSHFSNECLIYHLKNLLCLVHREKENGIFIHDLRHMGHITCVVYSLVHCSYPH